MRECCLCAVLKAVNERSEGRFKLIFIAFIASPHPLSNKHPEAPKQTENLVMNI